MVSTSYPRDDRDWAGRFIKDLAAGLARRGDIDLRLWAPPGELPPGVTQAATDEESDWLGRLMEQGGIAQLLRRRNLATLTAVSGLLKRLRAVYKRQSDMDLVHANWLQNAIPLFGMPQPVLVSALGSDLKLMDLPLLSPLMRALLRRRPAVVCPNAQWMEAPLRGALGEMIPVRAVPFGVERRWFDIHRASAVGQPRKWLVVLRLTRQKIGPLFEWGRELVARGDELHLFGPNQEGLAIPEWVQYQGPTNPDALHGHWYPQAAGLITLSQHDEGRPQVILDAMAAGLPVIASGQAAHADIIRDGVTGYLTDSEAAFLRALDRLRNLEHNKAMGEAGRDWVRREVGTWDDCAGRYVSLYRQLLGQAA